MRAVEQEVAAYLASKLGVEAVEVSNMLRIYGGASRETWMLRACYESGGRRHEEELVLRKDPPASLLETDRELEFAFYSAYDGTTVPVPRMRWLENGDSVLGSPFFVMDRILGCDTSTGRILEAEYDSVREQIGRRHYEILADIHQLDWRDTPIADVVQPLEPSECWLRELNHWEAIINREELVPQPITRAAIRWLRRNPPPPPERVTPVHGDYRTGNFLYRLDGDIHGIVDWEMAHVGDPVEDIAWSFMEAWEWARNGLKGGIIAAAEALRAYEAASGRPVSKEALHWWTVFSGVKGQAIWLTGTRSFQEGRSPELVLPVTSYWLTNFQDEIILRSLGRGA